MHKHSIFLLVVWYTACYYVGNKQYCLRTNLNKIKYD